MSKLSSIMLVVDDESDLRELIAEVFRDHGFEVITASGGDAAFKILKERSFDVVISDVRMPEGSGVELIENINAHLNPMPKLFLCSGFNDLTQSRAKELKVLKVFSKPFGVKEMIKWVKSSLE